MRDRRPYLRGVAGPEQPMLIGADRPEYWDRQVGEGLSGKLTHTERVDQEIVLDLINIPRVALVLQRKGKFRSNRTGSAPSDQLDRPHGVLSKCSESWEWIQ